MELISLYIRKYENIFQNEEFNFSSNYIAHIEDNHLYVSENKETVKNFYGEKINSVTMFLGQNGMGKSTLLDILGMTRQDRLYDIHESMAKYGIQEAQTFHTIRSNTTISYFMLYHLMDNFFAFEFTDESFIEGKNKISNIDIKNSDPSSILYELPLKVIFRLENDTFFYCGNWVLQWMKNRDIPSTLGYAYITSNKYNSRIRGNARETEADYMFDRKYYLEENTYEYLYKYLVYLKEINNELMEEKDIFIKNVIDIDEGFLGQDINERYDPLTKRLELEEIFTVKDNLKNMFINRFIVDLIEYYFLVRLANWKDNIHSHLDPSDIELIYAIRKDEIDAKFPPKRLVGFLYEYQFLLYEIERDRKTDENIDMKAVLQYVFSRMEVVPETILDICDKEAINEIISLLESLPEQYFADEKTIRIESNAENIDPKVAELLRAYDNYYWIRHDAYGINNLFKFMRVDMPKMSEGQRAFLDIIAKVVNVIYDTPKNSSLVILIDEPDRALHPELARNFLDVLLKNLDMCEDRQIQLILTSHSPFIVTDILPENVYAIDMKEGRRRISCNKETFATNIYYLLMDSFMLNNTFGEYSYKQLKKILALLDDENETERNDIQIEQILQIIDRIGEKTVKKKLMQLYENRENDRARMADKILHEKDADKLKKIREILDN